MSKDPNSKHTRTAAGQRSYSPLESFESTEKYGLRSTESQKNLTFRAHLKALLEQANKHFEKQEIDFALQEYETCKKKEKEK